MANDDDSDPPGNRKSAFSTPAIVWIAFFLTIWSGVIAHIYACDNDWITWQCHQPAYYEPVNRIPL